MKRILLMALVMILAGSLFTQGISAEGRTIEKEFKVKKDTRLELEIDTGGDVEIEGWDRDLVAVTVMISGRDSDDVEIDFDAGSSGVEIHSRFARKTRRRRCSVDFEIKVPEKYNVRLDSRGGDVFIRGVEGTFKGKTLGGELNLRDLKGNVRLTTYGGDITVEDSELDGRVKTLGGDIRIKDVVGDIKGSTYGGDVNYVNVKAGPGSDDEKVSISTLGGDIKADYQGRDVNVKTLGGDITISEGEEVSATTLGGDIDIDRSKKVKLTTMGGDINVREAPAGAEVSTMGGDISIGFAGKYAKVRTMGGDIELDAVDGWIKARTMGGNVTVVMVGDPDEGRRDVEISSMGGEVTLEVPKGMSMEFDIELAYTKRKEGKYRIISDFDIEIEKTTKWKGHWGRKKKYIYGKGSVGGGEHLIKIKTVNGNIYIKEGK